MPNLLVKYSKYLRNCTLQYEQFVMCPNQTMAFSLEITYKSFHILVSNFEINMFASGSKTIKIWKSHVKALRNVFLISEFHTLRVLNALRANKHPNCAFLHET